MTHTLPRLSTMFLAILLLPACDVEEGDRAADADSAGLGGKADDASDASCEGQSNLSPEATRAVDQLLGITTPEQQFNYCLRDAEDFRGETVVGDLSCRSLSLLRNSSGPTTSFFFETATSAKAQTSQTNYFIQNDDGSFDRHLDSTYDGVVNIEVFDLDNQGLNVSWDFEGFPTVENVALISPDGAGYLLGDLRYGPDDVIFDGVHFSQDPSIADERAVTLVYERIL